MDSTEAEDAEARRLNARDLPAGWFFPAGDYDDGVRTRPSAPDAKQRDVSADRYRLANGVEAAAKGVLHAVLGLIGDDKVGALAAGMEKFDLHLTALLDAEFKLREEIIRSAETHHRYDTAVRTRSTALGALGQLAAARSEARDEGCKPDGEVPADAVSAEA